MSIDALKKLTATSSEPITYEVTPDPVIWNADVSNTKQRPFIVDKEEYPFKSHWYNRDGVSMHYVDEGEGVPIVLTHGNPDWSFLNRNIIKDMSRDARVIAFDLPGFGFSDAPESFGFTPQEHSEWIESLIFDHLKLDKFILVVQDWRGPTGLNIATRFPEHILGVVISNTWAREVDGGIKEFSMLFRTPEMEQRVLNENFFVRNLMLANINEDSRNNQAVIDAYTMALPTPKSRIGTVIFPQQITLASKWLKDIENRLKTLADKPIEFIFGQKDFNHGTPMAIAKWHSHFPNANVQLVPDACHFVQEDSPESFGVALRNILSKVTR
ncbi:alpha/beta fold hydrolase [Vibrio sp. HN007]|uniref:alpha/beta fold hydrolase n=1 Tax=Vibrio iocasae TaxID=3098914 RepID=UPI0035D406AC